MPKFTGVYAVCAVLPLLAYAILSAAPTPPAYAQSPATPTPYPAIEATRQAAQAQLDSARAQQQQADAMDAQAAEMRRNAEVQSQQAAQAIAEARSAAAAQNGLAYGEALGRAESDLTALRASVDGMAQINATQSATVRDLTTQKISDTLAIQDLRVRLQDAQRVMTAQAVSLVESQQTPFVPLGVGALVLIGVFVLIETVLRRRPHERFIDQQVVGEAIDGGGDQRV
jgi:hypothetical protein